MNVLSHKAVLVGVKIRRWTGRRLDHRVTDEVHQNHGTTDDAGRYNKQLLPKDAFSRINSVRSAARTAHYTLTLPWMDEGARILPSTLYDDFSKRFRKYQTDFDEAADEFAQLYPKYLEAAPARLKDTFDAEDYPEPKRVRGMFGFHTYVLPCPDAKDFRVSLTADAVKDIQSDFEARMKASLEDAMKEPYRRIVEVVSKMAERLKAYNPKTKEGVFRDSLVTNVQEVVELLPSFNLADDKSLTAMIKRIEKELCVNEASDLREDDKVRKVVAKAAEDILKQAEALMA